MNAEARTWRAVTTTHASTLALTRCRQPGSAEEAAEAELLGKHAQTVYEGDPTMPPDMDLIMATVANAMGIDSVRQMFALTHSSAATPTISEHGSVQPVCSQWAPVNDAHDNTGSF